MEMKLSSRQKKKEIFRYVVKAIAIALVVIGVKMYFEHLPWGHRIEILAFEVLQGQMLQFSSADRLPVFIVDISKMPGGKDQVTPRTDLRNLVDAVARLGPKAIGIDVDFSPDAKGWKDDNDPDFFDFCLRLKKETKVPIFLGVYRTRMASPDTWLGSGKYQDLAVDITLPTEVLKIRLESRGSDQLPALSAALARAYTEPAGLPESPKGLRCILEKRDKTSLVNYSKLDQLRHETLPITHPICVAELGSRFFHNKMVVIGDATLATDHRHVPGRFETVPGVYVHACAAYTLGIEPLYELTFSSKILADLAVAMLVIFGVAYARFRHIDLEGSFSWHNVEFKWINRIIFFVSIAGILLVRWAGIMWLDFLLVIYALRLHPSIEQWFTDWWKRKKR